MSRFMIVYRGAPGGTDAAADHNPSRWAVWFQALGAAVLDRGSLTHSSVEIPTRLLGPKISSSTLAGYSIVEAADFNAAVALAENCPIFDEHGWVEIAHISDTVL